LSSLTLAHFVICRLIPQKCCASGLKWFIRITPGEKKMPSACRRFQAAGTAVFLPMPRFHTAPPPLSQKCPVPHGTARGHRGGVGRHRAGGGADRRQGRRPRRWGPRPGPPLGTMAQPQQLQVSQCLFNGSLPPPYDPLIFCGRASQPSLPSSHPPPTGGKERPDPIRQAWAEALPRPLGTECYMGSGLG